MKKFALVFAAAAITASAAFAADAVYSQNAIGFINVEAKANQIYALTFPFVDKASTNGMVPFKNTQLAQDADTGSTVYFWAGTSWKGYNKGRTGFTTPYELKPGELFFFKPAKDMTITINGEVPDDPSMTVEIAPAANISAVANPYPVATVFKDSKLAEDATVGASVYFWNGDAWKGYNKGRTGFTTPYEVQPGEGFFFKTVAKDTETIEWEVEKPYAFP